MTYQIVYNTIHLYVNNSSSLAIPPDFSINRRYGVKLYPINQSINQSIMHCIKIKLCDPYGAYGLSRGLNNKLLVHRCIKSGDYDTIVSVAGRIHGGQVLPLYIKCLLIDPLMLPLSTQLCHFVKLLASRTLFDFCLKWGQHVLRFQKKEDKFEVVKSFCIHFIIIEHDVTTK